MGKYITGKKKTSLVRCENKYSIVEYTKHTENKYSTVEYTKHTENKYSEGELSLTGTADGLGCVCRQKSLITS